MTTFARRASASDRSGATGSPTLLRKSDRERATTDGTMRRCEPGLPVNISQP
jgi:hypothetical protein